MECYWNCISATVQWVLHLARVSLTGGGKKARLKIFNCLLYRYHGILKLQFLFLSEVLLLTDIAFTD
jgi:hypothetical protein